MRINKANYNAQYSGGQYQASDAAAKHGSNSRSRLKGWLLHSQNEFTYCPLDRYMAFAVGNLEAQLPRHAHSAKNRRGERYMRSPG